MRCCIRQSRKEKRQRQAHFTYFELQRITNYSTALTLSKILFVVDMKR